MANPPAHFFKFIPPGFKLNLSIPTSFWANLNGERPSKAILRRGCREWQVDISDGGVFGDGWRKFVRENGVQEFDFIVFKHQGKMVFDFLVFDRSTCERPYPNLLHKMNINVQEPLTESHSIQTHRSEKLKKCKRNVDFGLDDARCFVLKMTPYYIKSSKLNVPKKFAMSNWWITERVRTQVIIRDERRRTWPATLTDYKTQIRLHGWLEIRIENHLEIGDTCMFELVKQGEVPVFNFYNLGKKPIKKHTQVKKETSSTLNNNRYFISTLKPCSFKKSIMYLPIKFSRSNGLKIGKMILRDDKSRSWEVLLRKKVGKKYLYLGRGFRAFRIANELKEGDAFKFEIVENEKDKPLVVNFSCMFI